MRFNQYRIREDSSAINEDELRITGSPENLEVLNATLGSKGTITARTLSFTRNVAIPVLFQDQFAGWAFILGEDVVLVGRASDSSPDDLYVFLCTSNTLAQHFIQAVKPCAFEWGKPGRFQRTWYHECARVDVLPGLLHAGNPPWSIDEIVSRVKRGPENLTRHNRMLEQMAFNGSDLAAALLRAAQDNQARMGLRRRVGPMDGETAPRDAVPTGTH
jgi:hypothetical protein